MECVKDELPDESSRPLHSFNIDMSRAHTGYVLYFGM